MRKVEAESTSSKPHAHCVFMPFPPSSLNSSYFVSDLLVYRAKQSRPNHGMLSHSSDISVMPYCMDHRLESIAN